MLNRNGTLNHPIPTVTASTINKEFKGKGKDLSSFLNKIFTYEPQKRLTALEILAHPFFDELRSSDTVMAGKYVLPQLFDFSENEISMFSNNKNLLRKIIPEWSDSYKLI